MNTTMMINNININKTLYRKEKFYGAMVFAALLWLGRRVLPMGYVPAKYLGFKGMKLLPRNTKTFEHCKLNIKNKNKECYLNIL